jgi:hypothetical protein
LAILKIKNDLPNIKLISNTENKTENNEYDNKILLYTSKE